ncbi:MAG: Tic22 family protein [Cyanobacteria bacterium P01_D01_bin.105]
MKFFIRRPLAPLMVQTLAVCALSLGIATAIETIAPTGPAFALTQQEVASRLATVPAFVISVGDNLVSYPAAQAEGEDGNNDVMFVFLSRQDAEDYIATTRSREDLQSLPPEATVMVRSLEYLYTLEKTSQTEGDRKLNLVYVPETDEAQQAAALNADFNRGVPLFFPQFEDGSIVSISQDNGDKIFPMFFSKADLESLLADLNERNAEARSALSVGVVPLEIVLSQMLSSEDDTFEQVRLLPDSVIINELQQNSAQGR